MVRVTRAGGRVGVIVRALDASWWVNLPLRTELKRKLESLGRLGSGVAAGGCADATIYRRFHRAGLKGLAVFPHLVPVTEADPRFTLFQQQLLATLDAEEADQLRSAVAEAEAEGTFFMPSPSTAPWASNAERPSIVLLAAYPSEPVMRLRTRRP